MLNRGVGHMQTTRKETILQKVEIEQPTYEDHFYARYVREKLLEEDELSYEEEAFMKGYEEEDLSSEYTSFDRPEGII